MCNPPPINRNPSPILLSPRPLDGQVSIAHQCLPDVIEAVIDVVLLWLQQVFVCLTGSVEVHSGFEREQECPHVVEAVQLVKNGNVVDLADGLVRGLAWRKRELLGVGNEHETIAGRREIIAPCLVCLGRRRRGEEGTLERDLLRRY